MLWILGILALIDLVILPPQYQPSSRAIVLAIDAYQATLSKAMPGMGVECRFTPTCSHYSEAMIDRFGTLRGGLAMTWRLIRCGPWTAAGTVDPPEAKPSDEEPPGSSSISRESEPDPGSGNIDIESLAISPIPG